MATGDVNINPGTPVIFRPTGGTFLFTPTSVGAQAGRSSAEWDKGTGAQPGEFEWRAKCGLGITPAAPTLAETIDIYLATSDGTIVDGNVTPGDAAFTDFDALKNLHYIGSLLVDSTSAHIIQSSGTFPHVARFATLVWWNNTLNTSLSATSTEFEFIATPIPAQAEP